MKVMDKPQPNANRCGFLSAIFTSLTTALLTSCVLFRAASSSAQSAYYVYGGGAMVFSVSGNEVDIGSVGPIPAPVTNDFTPLRFPNWTIVDGVSTYYETLTINQEPTQLIYAGYFETLNTNTEIITRHDSVVGLDRLSIPPGDSLLVNQFAHTNSIFSYTNNTVSELFPTVPPGTTIFEPSSGGYVASTFMDSWSQPDLRLLLGEAFILRNRSETNFLVTFWGDASEGAFVENLPAGRSLVGLPGPWSGRLDTDLGYVPSAGDRVWLQDQLSSGSTSLDKFFYNGSSWFPQEPVIPPDQSFWLQRRSPTNWTWIQDPLNPQTNSVTAMLFTNYPAQLNFCTYNSTSGLGRVYTCGGTTPVDGSFLGQLYAGTNSAETNLVPVSVPASFLSGAFAGYIVSGLVTIPNTTAGQTVYVQLRVWPSAAGASYEAAVSNGVATGKSAIILLGANSDYSPPDANSFPSFAVECPPEIVTGDNSFGFSSGQFGFNVSGTSGKTVILEASTNLLNWFPVATNVFGTGPLFLSDPNSTRTGGRYYRVLEQE